jgi:hypothetical protein
MYKKMFHPGLEGMILIFTHKLPRWLVDIMLKNHFFLPVNNIHDIGF